MLETQPSLNVLAQRRPHETKGVLYTCGGLFIRPSSSRRARRQRHVLLDRMASTEALTVSQVYLANDLQRTVCSQ